MAIQNRGSILAVKEETTEGTPVVPTAGTDAIASQDDFDSSPDRELLENAEITSSLGPAKPSTGIESPTMTFSHYLRHSGVEGQEPNYKSLLKSLLGAVDTQSTERDTVASSTVSVVKVDSGEGAEFRRGMPLLVKDSTNGFSIRPIHSISTDDLTLGFDLANAPGTGVNLGKPIVYYPTNTGHPTLSLWRYWANSGAIELMAGSRIVNSTISIVAGQFINASYSSEGIQHYKNPITIDSDDVYLDFTDDDGTFAVQITAKTYTSPHEVASALQTAMNASGTTETHAVVWNDTGTNAGKFTISTSTSAVLSLLWNTGTNAANTIGDAIGFSVAADDTGATTYTSDSVQSWAFPFTASFDSADPLVAKDNELFIGDSDSITCLDGSEITVTIDVPKTDILSVCEESGKQGSIPASRAGTVEATLLLNQHDCDVFNRFQNNTETRFLYNFGTKSGGNWQAGKSGSIYISNLVITQPVINVADDLVVVSVTGQSFVNSDGDTEMHIGFV